MVSFKMQVFNNASPSFSKQCTNQCERQSSSHDMVLTSLIRQRLWGSIYHELKNNPNSQIPIDDSTQNEVTEDTIIHFACKCQAPLIVINQLSLRYPQSLESADEFGRFPIHVATKWGATQDVIIFLVRTNLPAAGLQDDLGKTPMHYVGECHAHQYTLCLTEENVLQVLKILKIAAPLSVNLEDNEDMNSIEYALEHDASLKVIKYMQRRCM